MRSDEQLSGWSKRHPAWTWAAGVAAVGILVTAAVVSQSGRVMLSPAIGVPEAPARVNDGLMVGEGRSQDAKAFAAEILYPPDRMIVSTATLTIATRDFDRARADVDRITRDAGGFIGEVTIHGGPESSRLLRGTLRVPSTALDAAVVALKQLGQVHEESRRSDDVTEGVRDVEARLANARAAERRVLDLLSTRTGTLADVLAAERELARIREQIEQLDANRQAVAGQVAHAAIHLQIRELRPESLQVGSQALSWRFRDAFVGGARKATAGVIATALFLVRILPSLLVLAVVLTPIAVIIRRRRSRRVPAV